jgi:hypothetical protein
VREFIDAATAKKNPQIVTAIGQYLTDHEGQERFTRSEVKAKIRPGRRADAREHRARRRPGRHKRLDRREPTERVLRHRQRTAGGGGEVRRPEDSAAAAPQHEEDHLAGEEVVIMDEGILKRIKEVEQAVDLSPGSARVWRLDALG